MTTPAGTRIHADAIVAALVAAGVVADHAEAASDAVPRTVVYVAPGWHDGTLGDRYRDLQVPFQTTSIGVTSTQALWQHDKTTAALLGATPSVPGRVSHPVYMDAPGQPVQRDDTGAVPLFYAVATWVFHTTA